MKTLFLTGDVEDRDDLVLGACDEGDHTHVLHGFDSLEAAEAKTTDPTGCWLFTDRGDGVEAIEWRPEWPTCDFVGSWPMPADGVTFGEPDDED